MQRHLLQLRNCFLNLTSSNVCRGFFAIAGLATQIVVLSLVGTSGVSSPNSSSLLFSWVSGY
jgi:hypothetical protein